MAQNLYDQLLGHIDLVLNDSSQALDQQLFREAKVALPISLEEGQRHHLVTKLAALLPVLQQDPTPPVDLLRRILQDFSFKDITQFENLPLTDGLTVGDHMVAFNRLVIALLSKASNSSADAAIVAGMLDTVLALVRLWLCTKDIETATEASELLLGLMMVDQEHSHGPNEHLPAGGQGLFWKRIFGDRNIYRTFFEACSLKGPSTLGLSNSQRTVAQARLLGWLPEVSRLDWNMISRSHHPDIEREYAVEGGLLDFAAVEMVDVKDDLLMHQCLIKFYSDILKFAKPIGAVSTAITTSPGLAYLVDGGVHTRTAGLYLQEPGTQLDPLESTFLYGAASDYLATYASEYADHFVASQTCTKTLDRLRTALDLSPNRWAHSMSPKYDLHLLASLPRGVLLPGPGVAGWHSSLLSLLPSKVANPDALNTLASVFRGPFRESVMHQPSPSGMNEESAQARSLYYLYLANNPQFWKHVVAHADTVALGDAALAAVNCLHSVISANWSEQLEAHLPTSIPTPESGHLAILAPPALEYTLPFLLGYPRKFSNLARGRGDPDGSVNLIVQARFEALRLFGVRMQQQVEKQPGEGYEDILSTVTKRLAEGPFGRRGEVGGQVDTLEL